MNNDQVTHPMLKAASVGMAWLAGMNWGNLASMAAFFYTLMLIFDWWWKHFGKAFFIRMGWKKGKPRDFMDTTVRGDL